MKEKVMEVHPVPGDGDCFYHAFIRGLGLEVSPFDLRHFVANTILNDESMYKDIHDDWTSQGLIRKGATLSPQAISNRIRNQKEWATTTVIHILADAFNTRVVVYKKINDRYLPQVFPYPWTFDPKKRKFNRTISMYNHSGHFDLLKEVPDDSDDAASFVLPPFVSQIGGGGSGSCSVSEEDVSTASRGPLRKDHLTIVPPQQGPSLVSFMLGITMLGAIIYFL